MSEADLNTDPQDHLKEIIKLDNEIRGSFLTATITIESIVTEIIAEFYCSDWKRKGLLISTVLNGSNIGFYQKISILDKLLKLVYPDLHSRYHGIIRILEDINAFRNILAHAKTTYSPELLKHNDRVLLILYKNGERKELWVTKDEIDKRNSEISDVVRQLGELQFIIGELSDGRDSDSQI